MILKSRTTWILSIHWWKFIKWHWVFRGVSMLYLETIRFLLAIVRIRMLYFPDKAFEQAKKVSGSIFSSTEDTEIEKIKVLSLCISNYIHWVLRLIAKTCIFYCLKMLVGEKIQKRRNLETMSILKLKTRIICEIQVSDGQSFNF